MSGVDDDTAQPAFDGIFDADYLHFYRGTLTDALSDANAELIGRLLGLEPGMEVLDLACGHGRIANRLAGAGCVVTGLDASVEFLDVARSDAEARGVSVHYVHGDGGSWPSSTTGTGSCATSSHTGRLRPMTTS